MNATLLADAFVHQSVVRENDEVLQSMCAPSSTSDIAGACNPIQTQTDHQPLPTLAGSLFLSQALEYGWDLWRVVESQIYI